MLQIITGPLRLLVLLFLILVLFLALKRLSGTIDTCDVLYHTSDVVPPTWSEQSFRELVSMVTTPSGVEFSVDDVMYRQIDKVGMGSPLGPVLANIFAGFCESHILDVEYPPLYCRFVDDCWTLFC